MVGTAGVRNRGTTEAFQSQALGTKSLVETRKMVTVRNILTFLIPLR